METSRVGTVEGVQHSQKLRSSPPESAGGPAFRRLRPGGRGSREPWGGLPGSGCLNAPSPDRAEETHEAVLCPAPTPQVLMKLWESESPSALPGAGAPWHWSGPSPGPSALAQREQKQGRGGAETAGPAAGRHCQPVPASGSPPPPRFLSFSDGSSSTFPVYFARDPRPSSEFPLRSESPSATCDHSPESFLEKELRATSSMPTCHRRVRSHSRARWHL